MFLVIGRSPSKRPRPVRRCARLALFTVALFLRLPRLIARHESRACFYFHPFRGRVVLLFVQEGITTKETYLTAITPFCRHRLATFFLMLVALRSIVSAGSCFFPAL